MLGNNHGQPFRVLAQSAVAVPLTGTTAETTLATITIPANAMGANGRVEIDGNWSMNATAGVKTMRIKLGATTLFSNGVGSSLTAYGQRVNVANRNSAASQQAQGLAFTPSAIVMSNITSSVDTTASVDLTITGQLAVGTDTLTLESYQVILYPKG